MFVIFQFTAVIILTFENGLGRLKLSEITEFSAAMCSNGNICLFCSKGRANLNN